MAVSANQSGVSNRAICGLINGCHLLLHHKARALPVPKCNPTWPPRSAQAAPRSWHNYAHQNSRVSHQLWPRSLSLRSRARRTCTQYKRAFANRLPILRYLYTDVTISQSPCCSSPLGRTCVGRQWLEVRRGRSCALRGPGVLLLARYDARVCGRTCDHSLLLQVPTAALLRVQARAGALRVGQIEGGGLEGGGA